MSVTGRELRETLNSGAKSEPDNLILYAALAGIFLITVIAFVVIGLTSSSDAPAPKTAAAAPQSIQASVHTASAGELSEMRIEQMSTYNHTLLNIKNCKRGKNERKKFEEIQAGYERRNAKAVASWKKDRSKMLDKIENGTATDMDIALWGASGAAQRDVMNELSDQLSMAGSFEYLSSDECLKFGSDVRMKKYDIEGRPAG